MVRYAVSVLHVQRVEQVSSPLLAPGQESLPSACNAEVGFKGGVGVQMRREEYGRISRQSDQHV